MKRILLLSALLIALPSIAAEKIDVIIVDGQNNHSWKETTPMLKKHLESAGIFEVDVATSPAKGMDMTDFKPVFTDYDVIVSNYNGDMWSETTRAAFVEYMKNGGGFVSVHAADNSFRGWKEYNEMIGLGGWGGRNETDGPYVRYWQDKIVRDMSPGRGGSHGKQHEFSLDARVTDHPITAGLPDRWMHAQDELYDRLRGPGENMTILATATSTKETNGSGFDEPMLMVLNYGEGRVFHTALGHYKPAINCVGFITTLQRGTEWAATGSVTVPVPDDFPTETESSQRD
jgi:type 1 glutamine amidotransferase